MKPVPQNQLDEIVRPMVILRIAEACMEDRANPDYIMTNMQAGYDARSVAAYVDDLNDPKGCLILVCGSNRLTPAPLCIIQMLWINPDIRKTLTSARLFKEMMATAEAFARINECENLIASSWLYQGAEPTDGLWSANGFDAQEKIFVKNLSE